MHDNSDAIALYMLTGPQYLKLIEEFERSLKLPAATSGHHEEASRLQSSFLKDVHAVLYKSGHCIRQPLSL